jgi:hypothetical protein
MSDLRKYYKQNGSQSVGRPAILVENQSKTFKIKKQIKEPVQPYEHLMTTLPEL